MKNFIKGIKLIFNIYPEFVLGSKFIKNNPLQIYKINDKIILKGELVEFITMESGEMQGILKLNIDKNEILFPFCYGKIIPWNEKWKYLKESYITGYVTERKFCNYKILILEASEIISEIVLDEILKEYKSEFS